MSSTTPLQVQVAKKTYEAEDVISFELAEPNGRPLPAFSAGAHIDVEIKEGMVRQYSLCNHPEERDRYLIGVLREPESRGGSITLHEEIKEGDLLKISPPKNHFPLVHAPRTLLFAGGIGITPLLCMAERLAHINADFEMHYSARSKQRAAFLQRIQNSSFSDRAYFHFSDQGPAHRLQLESIVSKPNADTHIYICGPGRFIDHVLDVCETYGWSDDQLHTEFFSGRDIDTSSDSDFEVQIASSGATFSIPADKTVLQVLYENDIDVPASCEQGVCGTCLTRVLEGTPDHRDMYQTEEEQAANDQFTPCCSRAHSKRLVLDL
ncbi:PDR/VanB family oxidoreductase [Marinimicrobium alkaliphilum]|uniref:PDR/VanB family oxidoreductase n=1 Tax=Marinimicrobium alkaliphilum TaxID=2202654 RepID=UPI000DBA282F|nr:PDR/VanB family oxidoreductase [Marinimicrobium alkaliphilum]